MMKRLITAGLLALFLVGSIGGAILAAENQASTPTATARPALTEQQKTELTDLHNQMLAIREKMIDKYLAYGWITKEQANYQKDRIALQKKYAGEFGLRGGFGGPGQRLGTRGRGMGRGAGMMGMGAGMMGPGAGMMGW